MKRELNDEDDAKITSLLEQGYTQKMIAGRFGVSIAYVAGINKRRKERLAEEMHG